MTLDIYVPSFQKTKKKCVIAKKSTDLQQPQ